MKKEGDIILHYQLKRQKNRAALYIVQVKRKQIKFL
ncbi:hypothetical protein Q757_00050 [Oenococcus alcoholitolerans]|uniref:Uncharacterized protein n=1 Tax=Oenococcus alcoholitolerans TaxID=931074 RepID=A0ABR4XT10_9LACO|nr:hypothetical protein Q757_00050 [Oenococcus alcoholitolerans]